jgi:hypothetical protein
MMVKAGDEGKGKARKYRDVPDGQFSDEIDMGGVRKILVGWSSPRVGNYVLTGKIRRKASGKRGKVTAYVYSRGDVMALAKHMREQGKMTSKAKPAGKAALKAQVSDVNKALSDAQPMMEFFQTVIKNFRMKEPTVSSLRIDFETGEVEVERRRIDHFRLGGGK